MDAEALRGKVLGTCTLQDVIGLGTMGAVYLAVQSQPPRQVAVKVLLRAASLELLQQIEFLNDFRKAIAPVSSLEHPHIVSIYDSGDVDGLAYIVMPHIAGETLEDVLAREGALPLPLVAFYLEQIAAALDYAHTQGIIHRDLKPTNILVKPDGTLLLADFHLTTLLKEGKTAQMRLSRPGLLDYMAPEQILGKELDGRADLYSLGAILYRMVTGTPPFSGQTLMKVATKHLKMPPPSPRALRSDLPVAAEQPILAALAKTPEERYAYAQDLALAFRHALYGTLSPALEPPSQASLRKGRDGEDVGKGPIRSPQTLSLSQDAVPSQVEAAGSRLFTPRGLFDPKWRTGALAAVDSQPPGDTSTDAMPLKAGSFASTDTYSRATGDARTEVGTRFIMPSRQPEPQARTQSMPSRLPEPQARTQSVGNRSEDPVGNRNSDPVGSLGSRNSDPVSQQTTPTVINPVTPVVQTAPLQRLKNAEQPDSEQNTTGMFKLTGPAKIVSIPIAGQPGQYVTGILPELPSIQEKLPPTAKQPLLHSLRGAAFVLLALLAVIGSITFLLTHALPNHSPRPSTRTIVMRTPDLGATATAQAIATLEANTIFYDPLTVNIRNWPVDSSGTVLYQFINGAYHITDNDPTRIALAILQGEDLTQPYVYSLTMEEIRGDDNSANNEFGMIIRFTSQEKNGRQLVSFYSLEVLNKKGGEYQFWKYDNSQGTTVSPWKELAHHAFSSEFHQGQGPKSLNTFKIVVNGKSFTLIVNGKQVWTIQDGSLTSGGVGMLVNLKGTEVAFSNLRLTYH